MQKEIFVEKNGLRFNGYYTHIDGVLVVTAYGKKVEKVQRSVLHIGDPREKAHNFLLQLVEDGNIDCESL